MSGANSVPDLGRDTSPDIGRSVMVFLLRGCNSSSSAGALGPLLPWRPWLGEGSPCCFCSAEGGGGRGGGVATAAVPDMVSLLVCKRECTKLLLLSIRHHLH